MWAFVLFMCLHHLICPLLGAGLFIREWAGRWKPQCEIGRDANPDRLVIKKPSERRKRRSRREKWESGKNMAAVSCGQTRVCPKQILLFSLLFIDILYVLVCDVFTISFFPLIIWKDKYAHRTNEQRSPGIHVLSDCYREAAHSGFTPDPGGSNVPFFSWQPWCEKSW